MRWWTENNTNVVVLVVEGKQSKCDDGVGGDGGTKTEMWWWRENNRNVRMVKEGKQQKFSGGVGGGGGKPIEM